MAEIKWDAPGKKYYETGLSKGVLYPKNPSTGAYMKGVPWNGLTGVTNSPEGAEPTDLWADDIKYGTLRSTETWKGTIEAYTYPDEFAACDGSAEPVTGVRVGQQPRNGFGFSYVTQKGNDASEHAGYIIHLVYNCTASPSEKAFQTINDSPEAITFSWEISTIAENVTGYKPTATIDIDSEKVDPDKLTAFEQTLYGKDPTTEGGSDGTDPTLPTPDQVIAAFAVTPGPSGTP